MIDGYGISGYDAKRFKGDGNLKIIFYGESSRWQERTEPGNPSHWNLRLSEKLCILTALDVSFPNATMKTTASNQKKRRSNLYWFQNSKT